LDHYAEFKGVAMLELGIVCFIVLAVGYWATLFAMGRRDDVLHGNFIQLELQAEPALPAAVPPAASESLQALLATIKRDLADAAQV
jgi:hypothetical protein